GAGPIGRDAPAGHAAECNRIADGEEDVAEHGDPDAEGEPVVHERRARAQVVGERARPAQHQPGGEHDDDGAGEERGVELLAGVDLARVEAAGPDTIATAKPASVVSRPAVDTRNVAAELTAPPSAEGDEHGHG